MLRDGRHCPRYVLRPRPTKVGGMTAGNEWAAGRPADAGHDPGRDPGWAFGGATQDSPWSSSQSTGMPPGESGRPQEPRDAYFPQPSPYLAQPTAPSAGWLALPACPTAAVSIRGPAS